MKNSFILKKFLYIFVNSQNVKIIFSFFKESNGWRQWIGCARSVARPSKSLRKWHWRKDLKEVGEEVRKISGEMIQAELGASAEPEVGSVERVESTPKKVGQSCKKLKYDDSYLLRSFVDVNNVPYFVLCTQKYSYS